MRIFSTTFNHFFNSLLFTRTEGLIHGMGLDGPLSLLRALLCGANNYTFDISFTTNLYGMVSFNKIINQRLLISYDQDKMGWGWFLNK